MDMDTVLNYLNQYGSYFLFLIVFLEYLNLPGLPSGIIMPAAGILIYRGHVNFWSAISVSVLAGLSGSLVLYLLGYYFGKPLIDKVYFKYEKTQRSIDKLFNYLKHYGSQGVFLIRLMPVARTLVSLVAGTYRLNVASFLVFSSGGIFVWNAVFIYLGYAFGNFFIS